MAMKKIVITTPDGIERTIESGDRIAWNTLSAKEKEWCRYLINTENECKDRTLSVDGTHYKPHYKQRRKNTTTKGKKNNE